MPENLEPVQQSVHVDCPVDDAFRLFAEQFAEWWPAPDDAESCEIEPWPGGRVFERTPAGEERNLGSVTTWDPPAHLQFTWHSQTVDVDFQVEADGTRVTVIHTGWQFAGCLSQFVSKMMVAA